MPTDVENPITGLCIVANPEKCPPGYELIYRSKDRNDDCDLWKDSFFKSKTTRYLCYTRVYPLEGGKLNNVLGDLAFINEREVPPTGYTVLEKTIDTGEVATKKKLICVRMLPRNSTHDAITDIVILSRSRRAPNEFTFVGELNGMNLCTKMGPVPPETQDLPSGSQPCTSTTAQAVHIPPASPASLPNHFNRQISTMSITHAIGDVLFVLSPELVSNNAETTALPAFQMKTKEEIDREYNFDFRLARSITT